MERPDDGQGENAIQRSVKTLLDLLAPERATSRSVAYRVRAPACFGNGRCARSTCRPMFFAGARTVTGRSTTFGVLRTLLGAAQRAGAGRRPDGFGNSDDTAPSRL